MTTVPCGNDVLESYAALPMSVELTVPPVIKMVAEPFTVLPVTLFVLTMFCQSPAVLAPPVMSVNHSDGYCGRPLASYADGRPEPRFGPVTCCGLAEFGVTLPATHLRRRRSSVEVSVSDAFELLP